MIVKVCGVRTAGIAHTAVEAGADWIGLVFAPGSPREVDDAAAREVVAGVGGGADLVGVVVDAGRDVCERLAGRYGLAAVQVHGRVDLQLALECDVPVIPGFNIASAGEAHRLAWWPDLPILLDAAPDGGALPGGTGRSLPAEWISALARHRPVIVAGGLRAETVAGVIARVRPHGVDASSGLESAPGVKDAGLVRAYVRAARTAARPVAGAPGAPAPPATARG